MNSDPSLLRDRLSYALFREHGVPAPRAVHARVLINGKLEGLFVAVEQIDGRFTRARWSDGGKGNLYKDAWPIHSDPNEYLFALETNEDDNPSVERMLAFSRAITAGDDASLQTLADPEYLARYMAVDRVIVNDDGVFHFYCEPGQPGSNHNYYWYEAEQRLWLIPWDMDFAFDGSPWVRLRPAWSAEATCSCEVSEYGAQVPASCDPVVRQLMRLQAAYEREIDAFLAGPFAADRIDSKLIAWTDQIRPFVIEAAGIRHAPNESDWTTAVYALDATISATRERRGLPF
jgi:spore coat protein CotH